MYRRLTLLFLIAVLFTSAGYSQCDPDTPVWTIDMSSNADSIWDQKAEPRKDYCCDAAGTDRCINFIVTLHESAGGIYFGARSPGPSGAMYFVFECDPLKKYIVNQDTACVDGPGPHSITICKPGGDNPIYTIASIAAAEVSPPITVSDACVDTLNVTGLIESTITWTSIPSDPLYNSYLSCAAGCDTTIITPSGNYPASVTYQVCGTMAGMQCGAGPGGAFCDTTTVYFVSTFDAQILPQNPAICSGGAPVTLTATPIGGLPPYTYLWKGGATTPSINVTSGNAGQYWVEIRDSMNCMVVQDTVTVIEFSQNITANAGSNITVCSSNPVANLNGSVTGVTTGIWSGGLGTFAANNTTLNASYTLDPSEVTAGTVTLKLLTTNTGTCPADSSTVTITVENTGTVDAGPNGFVCPAFPTVTLSGAVTVYPTWQWSTGGTGTFNDNGDLNAVYTPSSADTDAGAVTLTLTASGIACPPVFSTMQVINIIDTIQVIAGNDSTVCVGSIQLNGQIINGATIQWTSSGNGTFSPNGGVLNPVYNFSSQDSTNGSVTLYLTTTGSNACNTETDSLIVTLAPPILVNASSSNDSACVNTTTPIAITGSSSTGSGTWSTLGNGTFPSGSGLLNTDYLPGTTDTTNGYVDLVLSSTNNGNCAAVTDTMRIIFLPAPLAAAGANIFVCSSNLVAALSGSAINAGGIQWSSPGSGTFNPDANTLNASYTLSSADSLAGSVILTLTASNAQCPAHSSQLTISVLNDSTEIMIPSNDTTICSNTIQLTGQTVNTATYQWSTSGDGIFAPNDTDLNPSYTFGANDILNGSVQIKLTLTGVGSCFPKYDSILVSLAPVLSVSVATSNDTACVNTTTPVSIGGASSTTTGIWSTLGDGSFSPNNTTINTGYVPGVNDRTNNSVTLVLSSTNPYGCANVTDTMDIYLRPLSVSNAGSDIYVCPTNPVANLNGSVLNANGGYWISSGSGSFAPDSSDLNAVYTLSNAEVTAGFANLSLVTTGNGVCTADTNQVTIFTITDTSAVVAGNDTTICEGSFQLSGQLTNTSTILWTSSGDGSFTPNTSTLNAVYTFGTQDNTDRTVVLYLTSTTADNCFTNTDSITISLKDPITVSVSNANDTSCVNTSTPINIGGNSSTGSASWSTLGDGSFGSATSNMSNSYTPGVSDTTNKFVLLVLTTTNNDGCASEKDTMRIDFLPAPLSNPGSDIYACPNERDVILSGSILNASGGEWNTGGTGIFTPDSSALNATYTISDADTTLGSVMLFLTTTGNGLCAAHTDSLSIIMLKDTSELIIPGNDTTICSGVIQLNGQQVNTATYMWSTSGDGSFAPSNTIINPSYTFGSNDLVNGSVQIKLTANGVGACFPKADSLIVSLFPPIAVNVSAANDTACVNSTSPVSISGSTSTGIGIWSTLGDGVFSDASVLSTDYLPGINDRNNSLVKLVLTSGNPNGCSNVSDTMTLILRPAPIATAGSDIYVCPANPIANLNGSVLNASGGYWISSGTGNFAPDSSFLNATYTLSDADTTAGSVILSLITTGNGSCSADTNLLSILTLEDTTRIIIPSHDTIVCDGTLQLNGQLVNATGNKWFTSGDGTFVPHDSIINPVYIFGPQDSINGSAVITLTLTGIGNCFPKSDSITVSLADPISVSVAFSNVTACVNSQTPIAISGSSSTSLGVWSSLGDGTFTPNDSILSTSYLPGAADTAVGFVNLVLTSINTQGCSNTTATMRIDFLPAPLAVAGTDIFVCKTNLIAPLNGSVFNAGGGTWLTSGTGTFSPNNTILGGNYLLSAGDTAAGFVTLSLVTTGISGVCQADTSTLTIFTFEDMIAVNAGNDTMICSGQIQLNGDVEIASGGTWTTLGSGTFSPNNNVLNPVYALSPADSSNGSVSLILTTTGNNNCVPKKDTIVISVAPPIVINASAANDTICANANDTVPLNATSSTGLGYWSTLGFGQFYPNNNQLNTGYVPDPQDTLTGSVTLVFNSINPFGCAEVTDTVQIILMPTPIPDFTFNEECLNEATDFTNTTNNKGDITSWSWNFGGGNSSSVENPSFTFANDTTFDVTLTVTSSNGCINSATKAVIVHSLPQANFTNSKTCFPDTTMFQSVSVSTDGAINQWLWNFGDGSNSSAIENPNHIYGTDGNSAVTLMVTDANNCKDTISKVVTVDGSPTAGFTINPLVVYPDQEVNFTDNSIGAFSYEWDFGDTLGTSAAQNPTYIYNNGGTYTVTQIVTNDLLCTDTITNDVIVTMPPKIPTGFTPNGDGTNDVLYPMGGPYIKLEFTIYNDWGEIIFVSKSQSDGWNGTRNGILQPMGVYVYTLDAITEDGKAYKEHGDVTLIR